MASTDPLYMPCLAWPTKSIVQVPLHALLRNVLPVVQGPLLC